jgi:hypothetical protein
MVEDSKVKNNLNLIKRSNSLEEMKRYFGIEEPDDHQFEKYLEKHAASSNTSGKTYQLALIIPHKLEASVCRSCFESISAFLD